MPLKDFIGQTPDALLLVVHARPQIRHDLEHPALAGAIQLQDLPGCTRALRVHGDDLVIRVHEQIRPEGADVVFECAGSKVGPALAATCRGGRVVLAGPQPRELHLPGLKLQRAERSLFGVQTYTRADFVTAMALLARGAIPTGMITQRYPLDATAAAFDRSGADALKLAVTP